MSARGSHLHMRRPGLGVEAIILLTSILLSAIANTAFWRGLLAGRTLVDPAAVILVGSTAVVLIALHFVILALITPQRFARPVLAMVVIVSAAASYYMQRYGVVFDPTMLRSVLHTDVREVTEFVGIDGLTAVMLGAAPAMLLWTIRPRVRSPMRALLVRLSWIIAASLACIAALLVGFQGIGAAMRDDKALRYMITPANVIWSLGSLLGGDARAATSPCDPPEPVHRRQGGAAKSKPILFVLVVGETARAANFSVNGYARETNPELGRMDIINFPHTRACGTSTEVSLPCMFSPFGRADYDEARIRRHESLLHVISRGGFRVVWLDNQSGCKGVCDGLEAYDVSRSRLEGVCVDDRCLDAVLTHELAQLARGAVGDTFVVLHQLGNHGPAYFRRYPAEFGRFEPACRKSALHECSRTEIVNAYDNALVYTDHLLAETIRMLEGLRDRFDVAMLYVSDHGESLGEKGLYLHGVPYAIAPREQLDVPLIWWIPADAARAFGVDLGCLRAKRGRAASHDNLYHSVLGLLSVETPRYLRGRDLFSDCRAGAAETAMR